MLKDLKKPQGTNLENQGKPWTMEEKLKIQSRYDDLRKVHKTKKAIVEVLSYEFGRGRFSLDKIIKELEKEPLQWELDL
jgi:site-specific DNA-methyltransferase (adenine-specific)